ncbi:MAG: pyridoxal phosphate-dependent aminotransferase [Candidatus Gracilibacteria bacterium]|jgi:aspartate/methionine/tyrosine aminotransferase
MKYSKRLASLGTEDAFSIIAVAKKFEKENLTPKGEKLIFMQIGEPAFDTPENIKQAGIKAIQDNKTHYGPPSGLPELREAVAKYSTKQTGTQYAMDDVTIHSGAKPGIFYTINAVVDEGDEVIIFDPAWPIHFSPVKYLGGKPVFIELKEELGFNPDIEEVKKAITPRTVMMIVNTPANPTGGVFSEQTLEALAKIAVENNLWVISDEIYDRIVHEGEHKSITKYPGMDERTILINGSSKTWAMTGWRMGWSVTKNPELRKKIEQIQINDTSCPPTMNQLAALEAVSGPQEEVEKMRAAYKQKRDLLVQLVNEIPGFSAKTPKGAFYLFANVKPLCEKLGINSSALQKKIMEEAHVLLLPGGGFGPHGEGYIRFSYVGTEADLQEGCRRLKEWASKIMG